MCCIDVLYNFRPFRLICTSSAKSKSYTLRECRFMKKITQSDSKSNKWYNHVAVENHKFRDKTQNTIHPIVQRRMNTLNKLFMEHITDLMATGETAPELLHRGIEITRVQVPPSFQVVNVFWIASENQYHRYGIDTKNLLNKCATSLRHELSQLRVMGVVPPIQFVQDKEFHQSREIESRLVSMNLEELIGPDYVSESSVLPVEPQNSDGSIKIAPDTNKQCEAPLPEMRHDTFGLNHRAIMNQIKSSLKTIKVVQNRTSLFVQPLNKQELNTSRPSNAMQFFTNKEQKQLFDQFLKKQRTEARNIYKQFKKTEEKKFPNEPESNPLNIFDNNNYEHDDDIYLNEDDYYEDIDITYNDDPKDNFS